MTIDIYAFTCGSITLRRGALLEGEAGELRVPVPVYLVDHPAGKLLFDSGLHIGTATDPERLLGRLAKYNKVHFSAGEHVVARLAAFGLAPDDISVLVNSHLHFDHAGGNGAFPTATVLLQRREWEAAHDPEEMRLNGYLAHDYDHGQSIRLVDGEHDIFGDGALTLIPTPGHTPGHQSLLIRRAHDDILLAVDACYLRQSLDAMHLPLLVRDKAAARASLERVAAFRDRGVRIFFGHDPDFWAGLPKAPAAIV